jgi:hypothetical protein
MEQSQVALAIYGTSRTRDGATTFPPPHSASKTRVNALVPGEGQGGGANAVQP